MTSPRDPGLHALDPSQLSERLAPLGVEPYRGLQAFRALHQSFAPSWSAVHQLPRAVRERLATELPLVWPEIAQRFVSADGTIRYLLRLADGEQVEAVYLPEEVFDDGAATERRRTTFCISTQAGCPVNCAFCLTATLGLRRSLLAGEIVAQVLTLMREHGLAARAGRPGARLNLVYMGMGEPFLNYDAVVQSIRILSLPEGAAIPPRRITVSTSGIVDKIARFGADFAPGARPRLAISLNASTDDQRQRLMPIHGAQGGLQALLAAARAYPLRPRERLTFEYVLLDGVNDSLDDADRVIRLLDGMAAKVNLIGWNAGPELGFRTPSAARITAFQRRLIAAGLPAWIRRPRGRDIYAACGQLKRAQADREAS